MKNIAFTNKKAFTLIELLVVIAIIGLLSTMTVYAINVARMKARDAKRISDIHTISKMIDLYIQENQTLPHVTNYGESNISPGWWDGWWDISTGDGDGDGNYFLDFLVDSGITKKVPVDPLNTPINFNGSPTTEGYFYVFFVSPQNYGYKGGACGYPKSISYLLGIKNLETDSRPAVKFQGSDCKCFWKDSENLFINTFDYLICKSIS
jgi:prepilin-type N-terminal cleavage/methylation domain-containing protein